MASAKQPDSAVAAISYCSGLADILTTSTDSIVAIYLHGSACLGGWNPTVSDVDLLIVVEDGTTLSRVREMVDVLVCHSASCPGHGLECSIVTESAIRYPASSWPYLAHVNSGDDPPRAGYPPSAEHGDPDLLMHYAVCRSAGIAIVGASTAEMFGPIERKVILGYLADEMDWGLAHGSGPYALLNACRAREYLERGEIVSKINGGLVAMRYADAPKAAIHEAIEMQRGESAGESPASSGVDFVQLVARELRAAATGQDATIRSI